MDVGVKSTAALRGEAEGAGGPLKKINREPALEGPGPCLVGSESHRSVGLARSACHPQLSLNATQPGRALLRDGDGNI